MLDRYGSFRTLLILTSPVRPHLSSTPPSQRLRAATASLFQSSWGPLRSRNVSDRFGGTRVLPRECRSLRSMPVRPSPTSHPPTEAAGHRLGSVRVPRHGLILFQFPPVLPHSVLKQFAARWLESPVQHPPSCSAVHLAPSSRRNPTFDNERAAQNEKSGVSRTYVFCAGQQVVAYYALAVGDVAHPHALGLVRGNMPDPVPGMVIGRLAVRRDYQGKRIGPSFLREAVLRTLQAVNIASTRTILVHAISERTRQFYKECGFIASLMDPMTLMITVSEAVKAFTVYPPNRLRSVGCGVRPDSGPPNATTARNPGAVSGENNASPISPQNPRYRPLYRSTPIVALAPQAVASVGEFNIL